MSKVYALLFNIRTENEAIHTVQIGDRNKILMFESEDDAMRYSLILEAQDFPVPTIESFDSDEIKEFCKQADYDWEIISNEELAIPPEKNVEKFSWKNEEDLKIVTDEVQMSTEEMDMMRNKLEGLL